MLGEYGYVCTCALLSKHQRKTAAAHLPQEYVTVGRKKNTPSRTSTSTEQRQQQQQQQQRQQHTQRQQKQSGSSSSSSSSSITAAAAATAVATEDAKSTSEHLRTCTAVRIARFPFNFLRRKKCTSDLQPRKYPTRVQQS